MLLSPEDVDRATYAARMHSHDRLCHVLVRSLQRGVVAIRSILTSGLSQVLPPIEIIVAADSARWWPEWTARSGDLGQRQLPWRASKKARSLQGCS